MSVNSKMAAIADEIRNKTGLTDALTLDQMAIDIAASPARLTDVPDYVQTEAERVAAVVAALQNENSLSFIAFSDTHYGGSTSYDKNLIHGVQGARIISELVPIDFIAHLGDAVNGSASDSLDTHLSNHMKNLRMLSVADPEFRLQGNHDANIYNSASYLAADDLHRYMGRFNRDVVVPSTDADRGYFYADIASKNTRVICVNSSDLKDIPASTPQDGHHVSAEQFEWLISTLDMTGKTDWRIVFLSHHPIHWYSSMESVLAILDAYVAGSSGSITADGATISYNFSGKNAAKLVASFHGHTHNLISGKAGTAEIIRMGTPNGCYGRNNEYGNATYYPDPDYTEFRAKYGETTTYAKTDGTAMDTAFCVYTIDFANELVHATCYGAGYDRVLSYADTVYYSVTNTLTNISTNNSAAVAEGGKSYTATLTPADGYEFDSVVVTMGGTDVTASAYSNGVITIAEVTGNIVITATGKKGSITVDIASVGYTANSRWSTSDGGIRSGATGIAAINLITFERATGQTVRVRLKGLNWTYSTNCTLACFDGDTFAIGFYLNAAKDNANPGVNIIHDGDGEVTLEFYDPAVTDYGVIDGFKCSGYGDGADAVIIIE